MKNPFFQGYLDSLCGVYSLVNAHKIVKRANEEASQQIFNRIIEYLGKKKKLKSVLLAGSNHKLITDIMNTVMIDEFASITTNKKGFNKLSDWWTYSRDFLNENQNSAIILSLGGKIYHLTVISLMTDKSLLLHDSSYGNIRLARRHFKLAGYTKEDKYIIYPSQCWYLT